MKSMVKDCSRAISGVLLVILVIAVVPASAGQPAGVTHISQPEFQALVSSAADGELVVIDVRTPGEFADGRVPGAINIPHQQILENPGIISPYQHRKLVFYCHSGRRAGLVTDLLSQGGHAGLYHLEGDFRAWRGNFMPIEK